MEEYFVGKDVFVSTPLLGTVHISKVMGGNVGVAMSDSEREKLDLRQRLHLMNPVEKKAAMEKLGLGGVKVSKRGEWEAGMRGLGMPGYMRQSEWIYR
jgi:Ethanolamine utilization protein EutJ (predicted chaperonin)